VVNFDPIDNFRPDAIFAKWGSADDDAFFLAEYLRIAAMIFAAENIFLARSVDLAVDFLAVLVVPEPVLMHL
jgi:hypothetical protein